MCKTYCGEQFTKLEEFLHVKGVNVYDHELPDAQRSMLYLAHMDELDDELAYGCLNIDCLHCYGGVYGC